MASSGIWVWSWMFSLRVSPQTDSTWVFPDTTHTLISLFIFFFSQGRWSLLLTAASASAHPVQYKLSVWAASRPNMWWMFNCELWFIYVCKTISALPQCICEVKPWDPLYPVCTWTLLWSVTIQHSLQGKAKKMYHKWMMVFVQCQLGCVRHTVVTCVFVYAVTEWVHLISCTIFKRLTDCVDVDFC